MAEVRMNSHLEEISSIGPSRTREEAEGTERPNAEDIVVKKKRRQVETLPARKLPERPEESEGSFVTRIFKALFATDFKSAEEYVVHDVVLPAIQDGFVQAITAIVETMVYGESRPKRASSYRKGNTTYYTNYDKMSKVDKPSYERGTRFTVKTRGDYPGADDEPMSVRRGEGRSFDDLPFRSKDDVDTLIDILVDHIDAKGYATVLDLYAALNPPRKGRYTDARWGWTALGEARAVPRHGVWYLSLPPLESVG